jgi:hypothetical protein
VEKFLQRPPHKTVGSSEGDKRPNGVELHGALTSNTAQHAACQLKRITAVIT